jgi:hypothetical protein
MRRAALLCCVVGSLCRLGHYQGLVLFAHTDILLQRGRAFGCSRIRRCLPTRSVLPRCPGNEMVGIAPQRVMQHASSVARAQSSPCNETVRSTRRCFLRQQPLEQWACYDYGDDHTLAPIAAPIEDVIVSSANAASCTPCCRIDPALRSTGSGLLFDRNKCVHAREQ